MADTMRFDLVMPERPLASADATAVKVPGIEGDMTAMPDHAPVITPLRPGIVSVTKSDGTEDFAVTGGFVEVTAESTTVLAERAYRRSSENRDAIEQHLEEARQAVEDADDQDAARKVVDDLAKLLEDMV